MRRTKIVCTIGPASRESAVIAGLIAAGLDVARLNFSHGSPEAHREVLGRIRTAAREADREIAVLQDLPGPKIRTGVGPTIELCPGEEVTVVPGSETTEPGRIGCSYESLGRELTVGDRIMLSDGFMEIEVLASRPEEIRCAVVRGGSLRQRQGMNLPGAKLSARSPTDEDLAFLRWGLDNGVDYAALSFVRSADDVKKARQAAGARSSEIRFVAKIERPEAMDDIDNILDVSDAIMVARGDLGVELPPERIPLLQRRLIARANAADKPVITATQMLESMTEHSRPTRAEVSDVAHAIWDGTDAVMLSGETASGNFPIQSAALMARIAEVTDEELEHRRAAATPSATHTGAQDVIGMAAELLARHLDAVAIVAATMSGETARFVSMSRPACPVVALSPSAQARRRMALYRGIMPRAIDGLSDVETLALRSGEAVRAAKLGRDGDLIVMVYGEPMGSGVRANTVRLARIGS
jgi:pyruvate kinase